MNIFQENVQKWHIKVSNFYNPKQKMPLLFIPSEALHEKGVKSNLNDLFVRQEHLFFPKSMLFFSNGAIFMVHDSELINNSYHPSLSSKLFIPALLFKLQPTKNDYRLLSKRVLPSENYDRIRSNLYKPFNTDLTFRGNTIKIYKCNPFLANQYSKLTAKELKDILVQAIETQSLL
jgi:hypothetical protein